MGSITQTSPSAAIAEPTGFSLEGEYARDDPDDLGRLDRIEVAVYVHLTNHTGETELWAYSGNIPAAGVALDSFEIPVPDLDLRLGTDYCWSVRVRDRAGTWTSLTHSGDSVFSLAAQSPELTMPFPIPTDTQGWSVAAPATPELETAAGLHLSAILSGPEWGAPWTFTVELTQQVAAEAWDDGDYAFDSLLWRYEGPAFEQTGARYGVRYTGRELQDAATYLWRMKATSAQGEDTTHVGGDFTLLSRAVFVPGPIETVTDTWKGLWDTSVIPLPVGLWYDPLDSANLRVIDRGSKNLYVLRQSDRTIIQTDYLGGIVAYPAGLSGDPADSAVFWLLRAPWTQGAGLSGNRLVCLNRTTFAIVHNFTIADGRWTAIKVSSSWVYATNWDDGKVYQFNKSTGAVNNSWGITYESVAQTNPTGIMVDGTTLHYFFFNDGNTKRFLLAAEGAPTVITSAKSTEGLSILGGEMDTTTHTEMYGDSDTLGKVWKFTLTEVQYTDGGPAERLKPALTTYADA